MSRILMNEKKKFHISKKFIGTLIVFFIFCLVFGYFAVTRSGYWLISGNEFSHAKWVVILDGQTGDLERNDYVAALLKEGKADSVLILGRRVFRDKSNADFYIDDLLDISDCDKKKLFVARHDDPSTIAEAKTIIPWFKARNADTVILVTSPPATRRAKRLFKHLSGNKPVFLTADTKFYLYDPDSWIFNRESRKLWLHEMAAYLNSFIDLMYERELTVADSTYYNPIRSVAEEEKADSIEDLHQLIPAIDDKINSLKKMVQADSTFTDSIKEIPSSDSSK